MSYVTIVPLLGSRPVRVLLGSQPAAPVADGGWVVVTRPKKSGFTVFEGYEPHTMELSILFDGFAQGRSQEDDIDALNTIMRNPVGLMKQPSPVKLEGPVPMVDATWVIQSIFFDSSTLVRAADGNIVRVAATVSLIEYVEADVLISANPSPVRTVMASVPQVVPQTYTVQEGDTLPSIAARKLGSWSEYTTLMALNNLRDRRRVPVGTVLRLS